MPRKQYDGQPYRRGVSGQPQVRPRTQQRDRMPAAVGIRALADDMLPVSMRQPITVNCGDWQWCREVTSMNGRPSKAADFQGRYLGNNRDRIHVGAILICCVPTAGRVFIEPRICLGAMNRTVHFFDILDQPTTWTGGWAEFIGPYVHYWLQMPVRQRLLMTLTRCLTSAVEDARPHTEIEWFRTQRRALLPIDNLRETEVEREFWRALPDIADTLGISEQTLLLSLEQLPSTTQNFREWLRKHTDELRRAGVQSAAPMSAGISRRPTRRILIEREDETQ